MDNNIHSHTPVMDEKWIFLLIMNKDNSEKLYRILVETKKLSPPPGPPPLQSSISMASLQYNVKLGKSSNVCSKGKRDAYSKMYEWRNNPLWFPCFHMFSSSNASKRINV